MRTVTLDQPLSAKSSDRTLLGLFHTLMSYMGSIGYIMGGSGIKEADAALGHFERVCLQIQTWLRSQIYQKNWVRNMNADY